MDTGFKQIGMDGNGIARCRTNIQPQVLETPNYIRRICGMCLCLDMEYKNVQRLFTGIYRYNE